MPKKYIAIRDKCMGHGGTKKECEAKGAKIYNSQRKPGQKPVTRNYDKKGKK